MRGSVFRYGGSWYFKVDLARRPDGRRHQHKKGGFNTRREAQEALNAVLKDVQESTYVAPTKQTVGQFFAEWLPSVRHSIRPNTWKDYSYLAHRYVIPHLGGMRLTALTHVRLNCLYADLLRSGGHKGKPLSPKTVRNVHILVRRAFNDAAVPVNPAVKASPPRLQRKELTVWDAATLQAFLDRAKGHQDYLGWLLLAATGMRRGEVLNLCWSNVNFGRGSVSIEQSKTAAGRRLVALDAQTLSTLREWRKVNLQTLHVVTDVAGHRMDPQAFTERFRARIRAWGLPIIRLHDLRHTHATLLLGAGVHPKVVQERLGHSSIQVTLDIYSHVTDTLQGEAANKIACAIWR